MTFTYVPKGVCSRQFTFEIENDTILDLQVVGGCNGNLNGISRLLKGQNVDHIIETIEGVRCGIKPTSCPDQIAQALKAYKAQM